MRPEYLQRQFAAPKHWPIWALIGVQRLLVFLPWGIQRAIGKSIGFFAFHGAKERRAVAASNLLIAYPEASADVRTNLLRQHFSDLGIGVMEIGMAWWASDRRIARLCDVEGLQYLPKAHSPQATFLVAGHFTSIDMVARGLYLYADFDVLHRPLGIPLLDAFTRHGRRRCGANLIDKRSPKALISALKKKRAVWFAVDQADTTASSINVAFFGEPAPTNTTVSRLSQRLDTRVVPLSCVRSPNGRYRIRIDAPLVPFGEDVETDTRRLNTMVEQHVSYAPSQYYWIHRRFKSAA
ncbi:MAG: lysophospholipid acyltransferase family protein [Woeseiaceae bacterium]